MILMSVYTKTIWQLYNNPPLYASDEEIPNEEIPAIFKWINFKDIIPNLIIKYYFRYYF